MGFHHQPNLINDGLVLALDAADDTSFSSGSTTWADLSPNSNDGTLSLGTMGTVSGSNTISFDNSGTDFVTLSNDTTLDIHGSGGYTIETVVFPRSDSEQYGGIIGCSTHTSAGDSANNIFWQLYRSSGNFRLYAKASSGSDFSIESQAFAKDNFYHVVAVFNTDQTQASLFVNTVETNNSPVTQAGTVSIGSANIFMGKAIFNVHVHGAEAYYSGEIPIARLYKGKSFTQKEISHNYNVLKGRFGL